MEKTDNINPDHYKEHCSIECIDAMRLYLGDDELISFCLGNAFKYLWRHKYKNGCEDLDKAMWYLNKATEIDVNGYYESKIKATKELIFRYKDQEEMLVSCELGCFKV